MPGRPSKAASEWWRLVLIGLLAIAFGIAAILLPVNIVFGRLVDVLFGTAKPFSGGLTAVAALVALVAVVAIDALLHLFGFGVTSRKTASRLRGAAGIAIAVAVIVWPGLTAFVAVELIGAWAVLVGVLELIFAKHVSRQPGDRVLVVIAALAFVALGVCLITRPFTGAVLVSAVVGIAAIVRGVGLVASGIHERSAPLKLSPTS